MAKSDNKKNSGVRNSRKRDEIFISWSGVNSKEIAISLKYMLENEIFASEELSCFVSDQDISSGSDWWDKIKKELKACKQGILCITKENINAPWIYFEAGAMVAQSLPVIPLMFNCDFQSLNGTPLNGKHAVNFYDLSKFTKMIWDINVAMGFQKMTKEQLETIAKVSYSKLRNNLEPILIKLRNMRVFNVKYVYPDSITFIRKNTIFVSVPMSSIDSDEYIFLRNLLIKVKELLMKIGFLEVYCPMLNIEIPESFDGKAKAIKDNFPAMKQAESMLIIYPRKTASSVLVETGYGIALTKKTVIFHKEGLPYILEEAGSSIQNIKTYSYISYDEITKIIEANGMAIFDGGLEK